MGLKLPRLGVVGWAENPLWAPIYDWSVEHRVAGGVGWALVIQSDLGRLYRAADEVALLPAGSRVLDVPCGGGVALRGLTPGQGVEYVAADIAESMLERTVAAARRRKLSDQVHPQLANAEALPFADDSFDMVVSFTGLHCFGDPAQAVREMVRVLKPGGVLSGSTILNDTGIRHEPMRRVGRVVGLLGPGATGPDVLACLAEAGMGEITLERSGAMAYFRGIRQ